MESKIKSFANIEFSVTIKLTESEARALYAMTTYGHKPFLQGFYTKLGKSYMKPHEEGVITLFETIERDIPIHLTKIDNILKLVK